MKILVPAKRVPDPNSNIKVKPDGSGIVTDGLKFVINPFDEIAVEEALKIKDKAGDTEVILLGIGEKSTAEQLRTALAMGADRAILVLGYDPIDSLGIARVIAKVVTDEGADLVLMGKQSIDNDSNQAGQMLAELLGWPQATFASEVALADGKATVIREVDGGLERIELSLPAVITADLRLNEPRYASLPGIMKARKKEMKEIAVADLGVDVAPRLKVVKMTPPPKREAGRKVETVQELVDALHNEAKAI